MNTLGDQIKKELNTLQARPELIARTVLRVQIESERKTVPLPQRHNRKYWLRIGAALAAVSIVSIGAFFLIHSLQKADKSESAKQWKDSDNIYLPEKQREECVTQMETQNRMPCDTEEFGTLSLPPDDALPYAPGNYDVFLNQMQKSNVDRKNTPIDPFDDSAIAPYRSNESHGAFSQSGTIADEPVKIAYEVDILILLHDGVVSFWNTQEPEQMICISEIPPPEDAKPDTVAFFYDAKSKEIVLVRVANHLPPSSWGVDTKMNSLTHRLDVVTLDVYDISNCASPFLLRSFSQEGVYISSFQVDDCVILITSKSTYGYTYDYTTVFPATQKNKEDWILISAEHIYQTVTEQIDAFTVISSIRIAELGEDSSSIAFSGFGNMAHYSDGNLFVFGPLRAISAGDVPSFSDIPTSTQIFSASIQGTEISALAAGQVPGTCLDPNSIAFRNGYLFLSTMNGCSDDLSSADSMTIWALDAQLRPVTNANFVD